MEQKRPPLSLSVALAGFGPVITACWQSSADKRPDMDRVVQQLKALDQAVTAAAAPAPAPLGGAPGVPALLPPEQPAAASTEGHGEELAPVATSRTLPPWDGGVAGAPTGL